MKAMKESKYRSIGMEVKSDGTEARRIEMNLMACELEQRNARLTRSF